MEFKRCYGCMQALDSPGGICAHCGFDNLKGTAEQPGHALPCGTVLAGHYVVGKVLGQGGFGITYIGWNLSLEMPVCIKEYFPSGAMRSTLHSSAVYWSGNTEDLRQGRESFVKEARKAVRLSDLSSVVKVWDVFYENETAYIIMNYIGGETLKCWLIKRGSPIDEKTCFAMLEPVMRDLRAVHERGIIHRDIKPDNLMLTSDGELRLLDLGAAKDLSGGSGQSSYMVASQGFSPMEQYAQGGSIGPWTDVYAMCASLYYCVTGKLLPTPMDRMLSDSLDLSAFSPAAAAVLKKGLAIRPEDRMQSMAEPARCSCRRTGGGTNCRDEKEWLGADSWRCGPGSAGLCHRPPARQQAAHCNAAPSSDGSGDRRANCGADRRAHTASDIRTCCEADIGSHGCSDSKTDGGSHSRTYSGSDRRADTKLHTDTNGKADTDNNANANSDCCAHPDSHGSADACAHPGSHSSADTCAHSGSHSSPDACVYPGPDHRAYRCPGPGSAQL